MACVRAPYLPHYPAPPNNNATHQPPNSRTHVYVHMLVQPTKIVDPNSMDVDLLLRLKQLDTSNAPQHGDVIMQTRKLFFGAELFFDIGKYPDWYKTTSIPEEEQNLMCIAAQNCALVALGE